MGVALTVVHLRAEQTRCAAGILSLESQWIQLRREWWALQTRAARLKTPQRLRERVTTLQTSIVAPTVTTRPDAVVRFASDRSQE